MRGRFIVIYGSNNLGKSRQIDLLEGLWQAVGRPYTRIKYPIYDSPTGRLIDQILRHPEELSCPVSESELQSIFAENRRTFEPELLRLLSLGDVLGEDYVGTGLAWGLTRGVAREELDKYNCGLLCPDVEILLDGERFTGGIERRHRNEAAGQEIWETNRRVHLELAKEFGWTIVDANGNSDDIHFSVRAAIADKLLAG